MPGVSASTNLPLWLDAAGRDQWSAGHGQAISQAVPDETCPVALIEDHLCRFVTGSGGICTFCGAKVALTYGEHSQEAHAAKAQPSTTAGTKDVPESIGDQQAPSSEDAGAGAEKTAEAIAFKDRLVSGRVRFSAAAGCCSLGGHILRRHAPPV